MRKTAESWHLVAFCRGKGGDRGRSRSRAEMEGVGLGWGGLGTASLQLQHFPAMWKCQLCVAKHSDFRREASNENFCVKSPII